MAGNFLIEIGTEEIPSSYLKPATDSFAENISDFFEKNRVGYVEIKKFYTPRRIALLISGVEEEQERERKKLKGPPAQVAFKDGEPTRAAEGFAESVSISADDLEVEEIDGKEYAVAVIEEKAKETVELLEENMVDLVGDIDFPKKMRWESSNFEFARPIRWLVAVFGTRVLNFEVAGVKSSDSSYGHYLLHPETVKVEPDNYEEKLEEKRVIIDPVRRKGHLEKSIMDRAEEVGAEVFIPEGLLEEVTNLLEYPFSLIGEFDAEFLELPDRIVITAMKEHQRYFPVKKDGKLLNYFVAGINNEPGERIKEDNEKVLKARLEDAKFYWEVDTKTPISERISQLDGITWHRGLGSLLDRTRRIQELSLWLADYLPDIDSDAVEKGAELSKVDLTTLMIRDGKEFTELEGYIGSQYASLEGMDEAVCKVIEDHYKPVNSQDSTPDTGESAVVSLADRMDRIVGGFITGERPTGSRDPMGLRQSFNGFIRIVDDFNFDLCLIEFLEKSFELYGEKISDEVRQEIRSFTKERVGLYLEKSGVRYDIASAVLSEKWEWPLKAMEISRAMMKLREDEREFERLVIGQKRVSNIIEDKNPGEVDENLLVEEEEIKLYRETVKVEPIIVKSLENKEYTAGLLKLKSLRPYIDNLFDNVMVMTEDERLKRNRLALLSYIRSLFHRFCDFEEIVID